MKKIVGILAVAAVMVASVFAADVSAKAKLDGYLFNWDGNNAKMLQVQHNVEDWNPCMALSTSSDKAGAAFNWYVKSGSGNFYETQNIKYNIWFSPIDGLKFNVGRWGTNLNQETIDWCNTETGIDTDGYAVSYNNGGFGFDLFLAAMDEPFFNSNKKKEVEDPVTNAKSWVDTNEDAKIRELYTKVQYGADFGTINAFFDMNGKKMVFGAGYGNTFGSVKMFVNALAAMNDGFGKVRGEAFVSTNIDAIGLSSFLAFEYNGDKGFGLSGWRVADQGTPNKASFGMTFKATYAAGSVTPYIYFKDGNFLVDNFGCEIKPGMTGNCGIMAWEVAADMMIGGTFTLNVPVSFTVNW